MWLGRLKCVGQGGNKQLGHSKEFALYAKNHEKLLKGY